MLSWIDRRNGQRKVFRGPATARAGVRHHRRRRHRPRDRRTRSAGASSWSTLFGPDIVDADGRLLRSRLANRAFTSKEKMALLNAITHPRIAERTAERFAEAGPRDIVVHDMPLLVENDLAADCHIVLVVHAPVDAGQGLVESLRCRWC